jgi:hypothetical protein
MSRPNKPSATAVIAPPAKPAPSGAGRGNAASDEEPRGTMKMDRFFDRLISFFSSLRLTVVCLGLGLVLVFWGTLAQVDLGLYKAQNEFFRSFLIYWGPKAATWKIPIFPGGYLVGGLLLINLVTAHFKRFVWTRKKIGIWMVHIGVILLLLGQLLTDMLSRESHMWLTPGNPKNYSDSTGQEELAVVDTTDPKFDEVVAFPQSLVAQKGDLRDAHLPFTLRIKDYFVNSVPRIRAPMVENGPAQATAGIGQRLEFPSAPPTAAMDSRNIPAAIVEIVSPEGSLGTWVVSNWLVEEKLVQVLQTDIRKSVGDSFGRRLSDLLLEPQQFTFRGRTYRIAFRPVRFYKPYNLQLLKFSHDIYQGTDIPKNFSSRVQLQRPDTGEKREVLIYMNNPLRYAGETYYQSGFDDVDPTVTILQVVHNPSWLTPYFSCILVGAGLVVQFLTHLLGFATKRKTA